MALSGQTSKPVMNAAALLRRTGSQLCIASRYVPSIPSAAHNLQPATSSDKCAYAQPVTSGSRLMSSDSLTPVPDKAGLTATARSLLVDTLAMVRGLETVGLTRQQAETLTRQLAETLCQHKEKLSEGFVSKAMLEKSVLEQGSRDASFRSEVLKAQDMHHTTMNREADRLANDVGKVRSEVRYEVEKLTASQRLDLNLEKGRIRDELQAIRDQTNELEIKVDKDINALKAAVESTKNETIKYSLGMVFALLTVGLGAVRLIR